MYDKNGYKIIDCKQGIKLNLNILSKLVGFKVTDYEISICKTEIHYGNKNIQKDGFILLKKYYDFFKN